jgi:single-strand DNA-binding protein
MHAEIKKRNQKRFSDQTLLFFSFGEQFGSPYSSIPGGITMLKVLAIGHLGTDPEVRYTPTGKKVASCNLASDRKYTDSQGNKIKETTWMRLNFWGRSAEVVAEYLHKGSQLYVEGQLIGDKAGNPKVFQLKTGEFAAKFDLTVLSFQMLDGAKARVEVADEEIPSEADGDIPF